MREQSSHPVTAVDLDQIVEPPGPAPDPAWQLPVVFLGWLALLYLVYSHVHILFSFNENAWLQMDVEQGMPGIMRRVRYAFTHSYSGHYTPLFFCLQLAFTVWFGISEAWWRFSQLFMLAGLATAMTSLFDQVAQQVSSRRVLRFGLAFGLAAPFIFSPLIIDFVSWPFESGQIIWAALTVASVAWATRAVLRGKDGEVSIRDLGISLALGYGSLHILGLGISTMAGWLSVWLLLVLDGWLRNLPAAYLRKLGLVGGIGIVLTVIHGTLMLVLLEKPASPPPHAALGLKHFVFQTLGFTSNLLVDSLHSLWGADAWPYPRNDFLPYDWVYGLGAVLLLGSCGIFWFAVHRIRPSAAALCRLCWLTFSCGSFCMYVLMVGVRILKGEGPWMNFLLGPRYLWVAAFLLFGAVGSFVALVRLRDIRLTVLLSLLLAGSCIGGNLVYQQKVAPKVWPQSTLSNEQTWREMANMTRELSRAGLPVPDLPLEAMCSAFNPSLERFDPLLHSLSGLGSKPPLVWLKPSQITPEIWGNMKSKSPALVTLTQRMFAADDATLSRPLVPSPDERPPAAADVSLVAADALKDAIVASVKDQPNLGVDITVDRVTKKSVWLDPPTTLTYHHLPIGPHTTLRVFIAIHPMVDSDPQADGASFQVGVSVDGRTQRVADTYINPIAHPELRKWTLLKIDLSSYAGQTVDLTLGNSPGPANNAYGDWCIWGDPRLTE